MVPRRVPFVGRRRSGGPAAVARVIPLTAALVVAVTGCSGAAGSSRTGEIPVRDVKAARSDARELSSQLLDLLGLHGKVTENGPGVGVCEGRDSSKYFTIHHPWSVYKVPVPEMKQAMEGLKEQLPEHGWKLVGYGPDKSRSKSLTLRADSTAKQFSVTVKLWEESPSMLHATLGSTCFRAPKGQDVTGEY